jgi:flagellar basal body P-ring formation protein FlgA
MTLAYVLGMSTTRRMQRTLATAASSKLVVVTCSTLFACSLGSTAAAQIELQSLDEIRGAAEGLVRSQAEGPAKITGRVAVVTAGHLDSRLRLARCAGTLAASRPPGGVLAARTTVGVSCSKGTPWTVYVPVLLESEGPVLVTKRTVSRGSGVGLADVESQVLRVPGLATHYVATIADLSGRHAKRPLPPGTVLGNDELAVDVLVKKGQQVTLLAAVGGIEVRANGRALADGGTADRIRVQNLNSSRIVEGMVESADIVRITP